MDWASAIILGIVQGITEFLPISSSGHLSIFQNIFGLMDAESEQLFFDVMLHLGTLVAVFIAYWKDIRAMIVEFIAMLGSVGKKGTDMPSAAQISARRMIMLIVVGTLPLLVVLPVKKYVEGLYGNTFFIGFALIATGLLLFLSDRVKFGRKTEKNAAIIDALLVGFSQAIAVVPGLSRSGTTIAAGLFRGFDREFAVRFSFLLSIPAIIGANILSLVDAIRDGAIYMEMIPKYLAGVAVAGICGYLAIRFIKYLANKGSFGGFAYYCWIAGTVTLILSLVS